MSIDISKPELAKFVDDQVKAGRFDSPEQVIEAAIARLMLDPEPEGVDAETEAALDRAEAEFDAGGGRSFKEFAAEFRAKHLGR
jgi:Arc/MetJ-type ribon-helix-helix transcriptional regulator